jgi:nucleoside-diphosphate-sugar epimerase
LIILKAVAHRPQDLADIAAILAAQPRLNLRRVRRWVQEFSEALRAGFFEAAVGQEFNLASGKETRIVDLAKMINAQVENKAGIVYAERRKWDTKSRLLASVDRAQQLIGYAPLTSFEAGLKNTIAWFRADWEGINAAARFGPGISSAVRGLIKK